MLVLSVLFPAAAENAWARFAAPWRDVPRYTFTAIEPLADHLVVPHGEPVPLVVRLRDDSQSRPASASARIGSQAPVVAELAGGSYEFSLPGQIDTGRLDLRHRRLSANDRDRADGPARVDRRDRDRRTAANISAERDRKSATSAAARCRRSAAATSSSGPRPIGRLSAAKVDGQPQKPAGGGSRQSQPHGRAKMPR